MFYDSLQFSVVYRGKNERNVYHIQIILTHKSAHGHGRRSTQDNNREINVNVLLVINNNE